LRVVRWRRFEAPWRQAPNASTVVVVSLDVLMGEGCGSGSVENSTEERGCTEIAAFALGVFAVGLGGRGLLADGGGVGGRDVFGDGGNGAVGFIVDEFFDEGGLGGGFG
jgi:hypothetical protein